MVRSTQRVIKKTHYKNWTLWQTMRLCMTTLAGRPSIQLSDGCNLFSLLLFIGLESVRDESWSVASGSLTNRCKAGIVLKTQKFFVFLI